VQDNSALPAFGVQSNTPAHGAAFCCDRRSGAWLHDPVRQPDASLLSAARGRQAQLTKPPGSLGVIEDLACRLAALQGRAQPKLERIRIVVFAADHGVVAEGVSAYPQAVTVEMVRNFARGGAAISVLARELGAELEVVNVGTATDPGALPQVLDRRIAAGTANFTQTPAMTAAQLDAALVAGAEAAERARHSAIDIFIGGEMGIGNTTAASAVACALLGRSARELAGPGTGLDAAGVSHKAQVIEMALERHRAALFTPLDALQHLSGFEIAALCGAYVRCAQLGLPVLVDGFIAGVAALVAVRVQPAVADWLFYGHNSAEPGHRLVMQALAASPLLHLGMRLGEGSGAAVAVPLLRLACALHNGMETFAEAGVSDKNVES
jgi:nicotinate-nucleotide--dimethylbenzimidazole phosphoribosyltransferase